MIVHAQVRMWRDRRAVLDNQQPRWMPPHLLLIDFIKLTNQSDPVWLDNRSNVQRIDCIRRSATRIADLNDLMACRSHPFRQSLRKFADNKCHLTPVFFPCVCQRQRLDNIAGANSSDWRPSGSTGLSGRNSYCHLGEHQTFGRQHDVQAETDLDHLFSYRAINRGEQANEAHAQRQGEFKSQCLRGKICMQNHVFATANPQSEAQGAGESVKASCGVGKRLVVIELSGQTSQ